MTNVPAAMQNLEVLGLVSPVSFLYFDLAITGAK